MRTVAKSVLVAGVSALLAAGVALADPTEVHLTSLADYEQAWAEQRIQPVSEWNEALEGLHPGGRDSFREPQLFVLDELATAEGDVDPHPGLLMAWGDPADTGEIIAAWELVLPEDPDFTNLCITLTAWPRSGMTSISFSLQDVGGIMKGWRWPVSGPGGLPPNTPTTLTIAAAGGPGQAGSTGFWDGGIDLTQVVSFEFDESGMGQGGIPLPNNLPGFVGQWNYWHDIIVLRCPPTRPEHFACYKVDERTGVRPPFVTLVDQFTIERQARVHKAREICAPVDKNGEGVANAMVHLVCYDVKTREKVDERVAVRNQFGQQVLRVKEKMERLCVPSIKRHLD